MADKRVVLVVRAEGGRWKMQHRIGDEEALKLPPNTGAGDVNDLEEWFKAKWRLVEGSGYPQWPAVNTQDMIIPRPGTDRILVTLEHD